MLLNNTSILQQDLEIVIGVIGSSWQPSQPLLDLGYTTWRSDM
jgi:hypothetical protein